MFMTVCNSVAAKLKKFVPFVIMKLKSGFHQRRSRKQSHKSTYDPVKIRSRSHKQSHKHDRTGVGKIRMCHFSSDSAYDSVAYDLVKTRLSWSEAEAEEQTDQIAHSHAL